MAHEPDQMLRILADAIGDARLALDRANRALAALGAPSAAQERPQSRRRRTAPPREAAAIRTAGR